MVTVRALLRGLAGTAGAVRGGVLVAGGVAASAVVVALALAPAPPSAGCDRNATTATFAAQVSAATAGQTICLASGSYGEWVGTNKAITLAAASGAAPSMSLFLNNTSGWTIDGGASRSITISGGDTPQNPNVDNVTIERTRWTGSLYWRECGSAVSNVVLDDNVHDGINAGTYEGRIHFPGASGGTCGVTIQNSHFGGGGCSDGIQSGAPGIRILRNEFANLTQGSCSQHVDPIHLWGADNALVEGNYIHDTSTGIVEFDCCQSGMTFRNNVVVNVSTGTQALNIGGDPDDVVEHNTFVNVDFNPSYAGTTCTTNLTFRNNVIRNGSVFNGCAAIGKTATYLVNNFQLCSSTCAGANSLSGSAVFVGGATPTTWAGYALANTSPGFTAGSDGQSMGVVP
jgi:hypothetical protein